MSIGRCPAWFAPVAGVAGFAIAIAIMTASAAWAQAAPDTVYALTTFDVSPSATLQTIALHQLVEKPSQQFSWPSTTRQSSAGPQSSRPNSGRA